MRVLSRISRFCELACGQFPSSLILDKSACLQARTITLPFLIQTDKVVCKDDGTTRFYSAACVTIPLYRVQALELQFFPLPLLHLYTRRFILERWSPSELACLNEPLLAIVRRLPIFGRLTTVILAFRRGSQATLHLSFL